MSLTYILLSHDTKVLKRIHNQQLINVFESNEHQLLNCRIYFYLFLLVLLKTKVFVQDISKAMYISYSLSYNTKHTRYKVV